MKNNLFKITISKSLFPVFMIFTSIACGDMSFNTNRKDNKDTNDVSDKNMPKAVKEVILMDEGAVVTLPKMRRIILQLKNPNDILLSYFEQSDDYSREVKSDFVIDKNSQEEVRDEMNEIADFAEDGLDIKPGKQLCVGMNSMKVAVVYNTGDTTRFSVFGSARCDPSLYPAVWALDSMATEMYRMHKNSF